MCVSLCVYVWTVVGVTILIVMHVDFENAKGRGAKNAGNEYKYVYAWNLGRFNLGRICLKRKKNIKD